MRGWAGRVFQWRVRVTCPVRRVAAEQVVPGGADYRHEVYVWTEHDSAVDAFDEAVRVLEGWPEGARPVAVSPVGMYVRTAPGAVPWLVPAGVDGRDRVAGAEPSVTSPTTSWSPALSWSVPTK